MTVQALAHITQLLGGHPAGGPPHGIAEGPRLLHGHPWAAGVMQGATSGLPK